MGSWERTNEAEPFPDVKQAPFLTTRLGFKSNVFLRAVLTTRGEGTAPSALGGGGETHV